MVVLGKGLNAGVVPLSAVVARREIVAAIEFVADRETKEPFPRAERFAERLTAKAFEHGLIVWPNVGHVDGERGDLIILAPPLTVHLDEIGEISRLLSLCLEELS
jgi:adenosylmethionine-8-amino-7-oxononanoate aminotransferase